MAKISDIKLVEISEKTISIQNEDATLFNHLVEIDDEMLERYMNIQRDFARMQRELEELINEKLKEA